MQQFFTPTAKALSLISFSALSLLAIAPAQAAILSFDDLEQDNNATNLIAGNTYIDQGFVITSNKLGSFGNQSGYYSTSTSLVDDAAGAIHLARMGGGKFTLSSIDLTSITDDRVSISFTGIKADNSTVTQEFLTDEFLSSIENLTFTDFTDLIDVSWSQDLPYHQFDNIEVTPTTDVPEPLTILGTIIGAGYGAALKRKLAKEERDNN